jgi:hypothetical protein
LASRIDDRLEFVGSKRLDDCVDRVDERNQGWKGEGRVKLENELVLDENKETDVVEITKPLVILEGDDILWWWKPSENTRVEKS